MKPLPEPEIIIVENDVDRVVCNGGHGVLGHPEVYYTFDRQDRVECGYCDRMFVKERNLRHKKIAK